MNFWSLASKYLQYHYVVIHVLLDVYTSVADPNPDPYVFGLLYPSIITQK
jgi:hypothetical protein